MMSFMVRTVILSALFLTATSQDLESTRGLILNAKDHIFGIFSHCDDCAEDDDASDAPSMLATSSPTVSATSSPSDVPSNLATSSPTDTPPKLIGRTEISVTGALWPDAVLADNGQLVELLNGAISSLISPSYFEVVYIGEADKHRSLAEVTVSMVGNYVLSQDCESDCTTENANTIDLGFGVRSSFEGIVLDGDFNNAVNSALTSAELPALPNNSITLEDLVLEATVYTIE